MVRYCLLLELDVLSRGFVLLLILGVLTVEVLVFTPSPTVRVRFRRRDVVVCQVVSSLRHHTWL